VVANLPKFAAKARFCMETLFRQYTNNNITVYNVYDPKIVHIKGHAPPYSTGLRPSTVLPTKHAALAIIITTGNTI
jgi:hypothetical protein